MKLKLFVLPLLFLSVFHVFGAEQKEITLFRHFTTEDGLPHDRITHIQTDSRGLLWLCTWQGISMFDGYTFRNYQPVTEDSFPKSHSRFVSSSEDADGRMWFVSYNRQLYSLDLGSGKFLNVLSLLYPEEYGRCSIEDYFHTRQGITWVIIRDKGVVAFVKDRKNGLVKTDMSISSDLLGDGISAATTDTGGRLWVATADGAVFRISAEDGCATILQGTGRISQLLATEEGVYALGDNWLYYLPDAGGHIDIELAENEHGSAMTAFRDTLYIGTTEGSVYRYGPQDGRCSLLGKIEDSVQAMYADGNGVVWLSSPGPGITRYLCQKGDFKHFEQPRNTFSERTDSGILIKESAGLTWIKMREYGFGYYDADRDDILPYFNDPATLGSRVSNDVVSFEVEEHVLWVTTFDERGLWRISRSRPIWESFALDDETTQGSGEVRALCHDGKDGIWVGTKGGELFHYDSTLKKTYTHPRSFGMVYCIKNLPDGSLAVGTKGNGLCILRPSGTGFREKWFRHSNNDPSSLSSDQIYCIELDSWGRMWIATFGGGINLLEDPDTGVFAHAGHGFPRYPAGSFQRIRWLLQETPDRMIAASVDGLLLFNPTEASDNMEFVPFTGEGGGLHALPNNDVIHLHQDAQGKVWIATYGGVAVADRLADGELRITRITDNPAIQGIGRSIAEDKQGNIWIVTQTQITRYFRDNGYYYSYDVSEQGNNAVFPETTALTLTDGSVLFGCGRQLFRFPSETGTATLDRYNLTVTGILVDGKPFPVRDGLRLPRNANNLEISASALNHSLQPDVEYCFQLLGKDPEPIFSGYVNKVSYRDLRPGRYRLQVHAYTDRTYLSPEEIVFHFRIPKSLWSLFGWILGGVLVCFVAAGLFFMRAQANRVSQPRPAAIEFLPDITIEDRDVQLMQRLQVWLGENLENDNLSINDMADAMNLGRTTLYNKIKTLTGKSPVELVKTYRLEVARTLVSSGQYSISEVAYKVGFSSPGYFTRCFKEQFQISPTEYQKNALQGEKLK